MNKTLYIIGNGFDLAHGIKSSYMDYKTFLKYHKLRINYDIYPQFLLGENSNYWYEFEEQLSNCSYPNKLIDNVELDLQEKNLSNTSELSLDNIDDVICKNIRPYEYDMANIKQSFQQWVEFIDISQAEKKYIFENSSFFLSFNYTTTLECIYKIKEICHIHGVKGDKNLIMGHSRKYNNIQNPNFEESLFYGKELDTKDFLISDVLSRYELITDFHFKNTEKVLNYYDNFNEFGFDKITKIVIIGHSLSNVDMPYFQSIKAIVSTNVVWCIGCFDQSARNKADNFKNKLGISDSCFKTFDSSRCFNLTKI